MAPLDSSTSLQGSGVMPDGTSRFTDAEGKEIKRLGHESTFGFGGFVVGEFLLPHGSWVFLNFREGF